MPIFEVIFPNIKGTNQVKFCGSWDRWQKLTQLHFDQIRNIWIKDIELEYGQFEVKFLRNTYDWVVTDLLAIRPAYGIEGPANIITVHKKHSDEQNSGPSLTTFPSLGSDLNSSQNQQFEKSTQSEQVFYLRKDQHERYIQQIPINNNKHNNIISDEEETESKHHSKFNYKLEHSHIPDNHEKLIQNIQKKQINQNLQLQSYNIQHDLQANDIDSFENSEYQDSGCCCFTFIMKRRKHQTETKKHQLFQFSYQEVK